MTARPRRAYLVGGGIGSLAAAAFLVRDGGLAGHQITLFDASSRMGGSLDGSGNAENGYVMRGGRMFTADNYECTWELFKTIPSLCAPDVSVHEETMRFNEAHKSHSKARLVNSHRARVPVSSMGFSMQNRLQLLKLTESTEQELNGSCITDWLSPEFFDTNFLAHVGDDVCLPTVA